jgi:tetratricopeptide (TPR) repeat protein
VSVGSSGFMGSLHLITEHARFDPARLTGATLDELRLAAPDHGLSPVLLDQLDGVASMLAASYPTVGPFRLMRPVTALLAETVRRVRSASSGTERDRLVRMMAHLGVLAGHMSFDVGQGEYVDGYFQGALGAISEGGDSDMKVWALASWSVVAVNSRAPAEAADRLEQAVLLARRGRSTSRLAWVLGMRARALAGLGESKASLASLADAYEALSGDGLDASERHPTDFFDVPRLDVMAGQCLLQVGRYGAAVELLDRALASRPASDRKGRSLALLELAAARVREGEPEEGCRVIGQALDVGRDSLVAPVTRRAGQVVASLQIYGQLPGAEELRQRLRAITAEGGQP